MARPRKSTQPRFQKVAQIMVVIVLIIFVLGSFIGGLFSGSGFGGKNPPVTVQPSPSPTRSGDDPVSRWKEAVRLNPKDPFAFRNLARAEIAAGHLAEAHKAVDQAIQLAPKDPLNDELLGQVSYREGKGKDAVEAFKKALAQRPADPALLFEIAASYVLFGDQQAAESYYQKIVKSYPTSNEAIQSRYALLSIALKARDYQQAKKEALDLYQVTPDDPRVVALLGAITEQQKRPAEALLYYERLREKEPQDLELATKMAHLYADTGNYPQAYALWMEIIKKSPKDPEAKYELALVDKKMGKNSEAKDLLERSQREAETMKNEALKKKIFTALQNL